MVPRLIPVTQYAGRVSRAAADAIDGRLRRNGYVRPAERRLAGEGDRLLLDPVEAGLAKASMRGDGYGRIAAYVQLEGPAVAQEGIEACFRALQARHPYLRRAVARTPRGLALVPEDGPLPTVEHELAEDMCVEDLWKEIERRPLRRRSPSKISRRCYKARPSGCEPHFEPSRALARPGPPRQAEHP